MAGDRRTPPSTCVRVDAAAGGTPCAQLPAQASRAGLAGAYQDAGTGCGARRWWLRRDASKRATSIDGTPRGRGMLGRSAARATSNGWAGRSMCGVPSVGRDESNGPPSRPTPSNPRLATRMRTRNPNPSPVLPRQAWAASNSLVPLLRIARSTLRAPMAWWLVARIGAGAQAVLLPGAGAGSFTAKSRPANRARRCWRCAGEGVARGCHAADGCRRLARLAKAAPAAPGRVEHLVVEQRA